MSLLTSLFASFVRDKTSVPFEKYLTLFVFGRSPAPRVRSPARNPEFDKEVVWKGRKALLEVRQSVVGLNMRKHRARVHGKLEHLKWVVKQHVHFDCVPYFSKDPPNPLKTNHTHHEFVALKRALLQEIHLMWVHYNKSPELFLLSRQRIQELCDYLGQFLTE